LDRFAENISWVHSADIASASPALDREEPGMFSYGVPEKNVAERRSLARQLRSQKRDIIDRDLFEQVAIERSDVAFSELYDRFASRIYSLLLHMLRSEEDALDILQEIFILIWEKAPIYYHVTVNPTAWILQLARNRAIDELRGRKRRGADHFESFEEHELSERPELALMLGDFRTPETDLTSKEMRQEVRRALQALSPLERRLIDLTYFSGLKHDEVAEILKMPRGTVSFSLRRAIMKLRAMLKPRAGEKHTPVRRTKKAGPVAPVAPTVAELVIENSIRSKEYNDEWF